MMIRINTPYVLRLQERHSIELAETEREYKAKIEQTKADTAEQVSSVHFRVPCYGSQIDPYPQWLLQFESYSNIWCGVDSNMRRGSILLWPIV